LQEVSDYLIWNQAKRLKCFYVCDKISLIGEQYYANRKDDKNEKVSNHYCNSSSSCNNCY
jgi:hypothetical protein